MKHLKIYLPLLVLVLSLGSCQKFLDVKKNSKQTLLETANDCQLLLDNYDEMNWAYPSDGEASADNYYLNSNTYLSTSLTQEDRDIYGWAAGAVRQQATPQWQNSYKVVYSANLVLETVEKLKGTTDAATLDKLRGAALFYRSFSFWNIAQLYAKPYGTTSATDLGIPLRLSSDINDKSDRGTVKQTYTQIVNDLKEASGLLQVSSKVLSQPNKVGALAMLARVYLSMEDYPNALTSANAALNLKGDLLDYNLSTVSRTSNTPFTRYNVESLFHALMRNANGGSLLSPGSEGNPGAIINQALYDSYEANDLRKVIFFKPNTGSFAGTYRFSGNYGQANSAMLFVGLTTAEMYLTRAECYARANNYVAAMKDVNLLLKNRYINTPAYVDKVVADVDVLSFVLSERRKELVLRGQRWTDLRRLNKDPRFKTDISRKGIINNTEVTFTLPANDMRYTLLMPVEVITNSGIEQNKR